MDFSLRIYIDAHPAAQISTDLSHKSFEAALAWATQHCAWCIAQSLASHGAQGAQEASRRGPGSK
eukprot:106660-Pyramimonas_sp.AAC.1